MTKFVNWRKEGPWKCQGKYVRDVCIMGVGDVSRVTRSKQLFVNKIYESFQYLALDCMEQWYFEKVRREYTEGVNLDVQFYKYLPFVKNHL